MLDPFFGVFKISFKSLFKINQAYLTCHKRLENIKKILYYQVALKSDDLFGFILFKIPSASTVTCLPFELKVRLNVNGS